MEGQTNCVLCEFMSRSTNSLKQHMENKHNVFNMTIVQVLTQQVERVDDLENKNERKRTPYKKTEDDLNETKEALKKEKRILEEKKKAFDQLITSQKQKEEEESKLVEELKVTKGLLDKAYEDLVIKTNALDAELEKVDVSEVSIQTDPEINEVSVKQEESKDNIEEKYKERGEGPLVISHKCRLMSWLILAPRPPMHFLHKTFPGTSNKISHCAKFHGSSCLIS